MWEVSCEGYNSFYVVMIKRREIYLRFKWYLCLPYLEKDFERYSFNSLVLLCVVYTVSVMMCVVYLVYGMVLLVGIVFCFFFFFCLVDL